MPGKVFFDTNVLVYAHWDSLILAAAERASCRTIYSEDLSDGQSYATATVKNPYGMK